jgi:hypothetical protein
MLFCTALLAQGGKLEEVAEDVTFIYKYDASGNRIKREFRTLDDNGPIPIDSLIVDPDPTNPFNIAVHPNPTSGVFTLIVTGLANMGNVSSSIMIFNASQTLVLSANKVERMQSLDISDNPPGYYFMVIKVGDYTRYITIIKQ